MLQSGNTVPNFSQQSSQGKINFYDWAGDSWVVFFSHPADYTSVCTTELASVAKLKPEFDKRGVKVIALSVNDRECHQGWIDDIKKTQHTTVNYPIVADVDKSVSSLYGMIHPDANTEAIVRIVSIIDPQKKVRLTITDPPPSECNFPEFSSERDFQDILRVIESLQSTDN